MWRRDLVQTSCLIRDLDVVNMLADAKKREEKRRDKERIIKCWMNDMDV